VPPLQEYRARLARWQSAFETHQRRAIQLGNARLAAGAALAAIAAATFGPGWIPAWWLAPPAAALAALFAVHPRVSRALQRASRAAAFYERGLARLENRWIGTGSQETTFAPADHLYAADLDLFGRGSLFEFLSTARTATGERILAEWLLAPGEIGAVRARQEAVRELAPRLDLREDLALTGDDVRAALDDRRLSEWGAQPAVRFFPGARVVALLLALAGAAALGAWLARESTLRPLLGVVLADLAFGLATRGEVRRVVHGANAPARELKLVALLLERLEAEEAAAPALRDLRSRLQAGGRRATRQIRRLVRLIEWMEWANNQVFAPIGGLLLWLPQFAMAIEAWRARCGPRIGDWVAAVGEFEALASLASFAYERPSATFPELLSGREPVYEASALTHPLIPPEEAVANDVALGGAARLWIVSGSNMSGKSTLLRAVGVSVVMAWAGAPVTAGRLRLSRLRLGASLRANDSLADHRSRFYAEISRLKAIVDLAGSGQATLFLLDELLSGTNSHDRRIGAEALLRGLLARGAIGLATTHDLALAEIAAAMDGRAANVHFEDHLEGGEIRFDYRLRPGVVARGNALELMRAVGLDV
jgi:hypothetical protein